MTRLPLCATAVMLMTAALAFAGDVWPGPTPPEVREARMKAKNVRAPNAQELQKMEAAAPDKAPAVPAKPRRVLVWDHVWTHDPNAFAEEALKTLARKTKAFDAVVSDDPKLLLPDGLKDFDALFMNNIHEPEPFLPQDLKTLPKENQDAARDFDSRVKQSILAFVADGKGIAGVHAAIAALQNWKDYGEMMGGYYDGHFAQEVVVKVEDAAHPVNACFEGKPFHIQDEVYIPGLPFSRQKVRVLLSCDMAQTADPTLKAAWLKDKPKDYAITWVRSYGKGRVFYCTLGHNSQTYTNPLFLRHLLAGIQFAVGDLPGETAPSGK